MLYPRPLERLLAELERLPGIGPKSAQRLAFFLLRADKNDNFNLADAIKSIKEQIRPCERCGNFTDVEVCDICTSPRRENGLMCIVGEARDVLAIENSGEFYGRYHVLGGLISPIDGVGPSKLRLDTLKKRLEDEQIQEVILALSPTVEGETTGSFVAKLLGESGVKVTQLARGLPFGGDLDYADQVTIAGALRGRREL
ncbi:DNA replication and repair protein RecR [Abditibacterium utsteinense]|uniref:Recombination protein RecR n=1 Tax=Abditibacterium utsteinense TaxID=1960156 RepID=A0A2S8SSU6_9BACT|nr:recombination mediator RecR [Abditibacterium utsteinense]PQV63848.1 DNA replication and repair protein RecR [Abditibacterium utsteinense]